MPSSIESILPNFSLFSTILSCSLHLFRGLDQSCFDGIPIDNVPDGTDVFGSNVSVIDIVGMLPDINTQEWFESSGGFERILVGKSYDVDALCFGVIREPAPARSLNGNRLGRDFGDHVLIATESGVDGIRERSTSREGAGTHGCQVFPEQGVVDVSTTVEFEGSLESNGSRDITRGHGRMNLFEGGVEVGNVGLVMLGVMECHGFGRNGRLESVVIIGQIWKDKGGVREGRKEGR